MAIQKDILYFGHECTLACDAKCWKAWGINNRPKLYRTVYGTFEPLTFEQSENEAICPNPDDSVHLADDELGNAPVDPGTYEGGQAKPYDDDERLNKWCARECERSVIVDRGKPIVLPNYSQRQYNIAPHVRSASGEDGGK